MPLALRLKGGGRRPPPSRLRPASIAAACALLAACEASAGNSAAPAPALAPLAPFAAACATVEKPPLVLLIAGDNPFNARLYSADPCDWDATPEPATERDKISAVSVGGGVVAVTAAPTSVDQVYVLKRGELVPPPGHRDAPTGRSAAAGGRGAVTYSAIDNDPSAPFAVRTVDAQGQTRTAYRSAQPLGMTVHTSGGDVIVAEHPTIPGSPEPAKAPSLVLLGDVPQRVPAGVERVSGLAFSRKLNAAVVSGESAEAGAVIPLRAGARSAIPAGWRVDAADDTGELLLAHASGSLAVFRLGEQGAAQYAALPFDLGAVYGAAWLPRSAAADALAQDEPAPG